MQPLSDATAPPTARRCAVEVLDALPLVIWFIRRQMRSHRGGLSLPQFRALVRVDREPAANVSVIAEHLGASLPTTSRLISGLVNKGLLARGGSRLDRRQVSLALTPRGVEVLHNARSHTQDRMREEFARMNNAERSTIMTTMRLLAGAFVPHVHPQPRHRKVTPTVARAGMSGGKRTLAPAAHPTKSRGKRAARMTQLSPA